MNKKEITVEYARRKLGIKAKNMTEKQLEDLLIFLRVICNKTIDNLEKDDNNYAN